MENDKFLDENRLPLGDLIRPAMTFRPAPDIAYSQFILEELAKTIQPMTEPRITRESLAQPPAAQGEEASSRVVANAGNLFRGDLGDKNPIGSITPERLFKPAPGVTLTHRELAQIAAALARAAR